MKQIIGTVMLRFISMAFIWVYLEGIFHGDSSVAFE